MSRIAKKFQAWISMLPERYSPRLFAARIALDASVVLVMASTLPFVLADDLRSTKLVTASELLQLARENREVFSEDFPGFRSRVTVRFDGLAFHGTCSFSPPGDLEFTFRKGAVPDVVEATVRSMLMHRVPSSRASVEGASYGEPDEHPLGRKIRLDDKYESTYRIKDDRILQVNRSLGEIRRVLTVLETTTTASGRYLPRHVFAVLFDQTSGDVREAWTYISRFQQVSGEYLPLSRHVIRTSDGRTTALLVEWRDIEMLDSVGDG